MVASALDRSVVAGTSGELASNFVRSGLSFPDDGTDHHLTFDRERSLLAVSEAESGTIRVFDRQLDLVWEAPESAAMFNDVTFLMFLPSGDLLAQGRASFTGMGQYLLIDGEMGDVVTSSNVTSLIERGWVSQDGTTLFAQTRTYAVAHLDGDFVSGIVSVNLDPNAFGEQSQMSCAAGISLDETRAIFYDQVRDKSFALPLYTTDELVSLAHELVEGHELTDEERLLYHLE